MPIPQIHIARRRQLRWLIGLGLGFWTLAVAVSVLWNIHLVQEALMQEAERDNRNNFDRDAFYFLNPATMSREAHVTKSHADGTLTHITSLKPLNPQNAPDAWETAALRSFERGQTEALSREPVQGRPGLRFMKPMRVETLCLQCHAAQGYKVGDICGGISVAMPLEPYLAAVQSRAGHLVAGHAVLWALGLLGILFGFRQLRQRLDQQLQAEAALRVSEERNRAILQTAMDGYWLVDLQGRLLEVNDAYCRMSGYRRPELLTMGIPDLEVAESAAATAAHMQKVRVQGEDRFESRHRRKDRSVFDVEISVQYRSAGGGHYVVFVRDITGRKQAAVALQQSEERFRRAVVDAPFPIMIHAEDGAVLQVSNSWCEITGYSRAELATISDWTERAYAESKPRVQAYIETLNALSHPKYEGDYSIRIKDGTTRIWEFSSAPLGRLSDGRRAVISMALDVTDRRRREEEIEAILRTTIDGFYLVDNAGRLLEVNDAYCRMIGYSREELLQMGVKDFEVLESEERIKQRIQQIKATGHLRFETQHRRKDGRVIDIDASCNFLKGDKKALFVFMRDITERKHIEEQLRQSQKLESIGHLAGGVAHDFNNILASQLMQLELLPTTGLSEEFQEGLSQIRADADRAAKLVRQLLLYSRRSVVNMSDLDLNEVVTHFSKMLRRILREDIELQLHLHSAPLNLHADPGMIEQVIMNLATNARDAMSNGGKLIVKTTAVTLDAVQAQRLCAAARPGEYVCLSVSDTGTGIPPEVLPKIFEPFFSTKDIGKGTGLGLASVFGIVQQHQGCIDLDNRPGQGVTFKIYFPALAVASIQPASAADLPANLRGTETIFLVEDEPSLRKLARKILERHGYHVLETANGPEALPLWAAHRETVALLLTDMVLPGGMSGMELSRRLKSERPGLKVVYVSGYSLDAIAGKLELRAGETFIQKPFRPDQLLKTIRQTLDT